MASENQGPRCNQVAGENHTVDVIFNQKEDSVSISLFTVIDIYKESGLPHTYRADNIEFQWHDWLLCEIAWNMTNPIHHCIASGFRDSGGPHPAKPGQKCKRMAATIMNPTYEHMFDNQDLHKLAHFKVVSLIFKDEFQNLGMPKGFDGSEKVASPMRPKSP